jgi:DNA-binding response OmpR family regulator
MLKILIVEDNPGFAELLQAALQERFGFPVLKAASVREALASAEGAPPDLLFVDLRLPDGNGLQLTRRLRAAGIDALICMLTSHDLPEYREAALRSGADHFLVKGSSGIRDIFGIVQSRLAPVRACGAG